MQSRCISINIKTRSHFYRHCRQDLYPPTTSKMLLQHCLPIQELAVYVPLSRQTFVWRYVPLLNFIFQTTLLIHCCNQEHCALLLVSLAIVSVWMLDLSPQWSNPLSSSTSVLWHSNGAVCGEGGCHLEGDNARCRFSMKVGDLA